LAKSWFAHFLSKSRIFFSLAFDSFDFKKKKMTINFGLLSTWEKQFVNLAQDISFKGSNISSIKSASISFTTPELLRFLENDHSLVLIAEDDDASIIIFHHFQSFPCPTSKDPNLIAIAGIDTLATPVVINNTRIKNYSQQVPLIDIESTEDYLLEIESVQAENITLKNAIIIPQEILKIIITSHEKLPATLIPKILKEIKDLDSKNPPEKYSINCNYIINWLFLSHVNCINPVRFALSRHPDITLWFVNM